MTIAQVAQETRIRPHYLEALERDDLSSIPSSAQARGFLRIYMGFLELKDEAWAAVAPPPEAPPASEPPSQPAAKAQPESPGEAARPNLLTRVRERFKRPVDSPMVASPAAVIPSDPSPAPAPEPKPFVPVRYTEELPSAPEPVISDPPAPEISAPETKPARRKAVSKDAKPKPAARTKSAKARSGAAKNGERNPRVKKKLGLALLTAKRFPQKPD